MRLIVVLFCCGLGSAAWAGCSDFSGVWKGSCSYDNGRDDFYQSDESIVIEQYGCDTFEVEGVQAQIGKIMINRDIDPFFRGVLTALIRWDEDKSKLLGVYTTIGLNQEDSPWTKFLVNSDVVFELVDDTLHFDTFGNTRTFYKNGHREYIVFNELCELEQT